MRCLLPSSSESSFLAHSTFQSRYCIDNNFSLSNIHSKWKAMREINFIALGNFEEAENGVGPWGHHGKKSLRSSADKQFLMTTTFPWLTSLEKRKEGTKF